MTQVPYSDQRMPPSQARRPAPSARFLVELVVLSTFIGVVFVLLDVPIWLFYIAPIAAVPPLIRELRGIDSGHEPLALGDLSARRPMRRSRANLAGDAMAVSRGHIKRRQAIALLAFGIGLVALVLIALQRGEFSDSGGSTHLPRTEAHAKPLVPPRHHRSGLPSQPPGAVPKPQEYAEAPPQPGGGDSQSPPSATHPHHPPSVGAAGPPPKENVPPNEPEAQPATADTGSSPLVPILIAIVVLAAISVAVVMVRQRRQRRGREPARHRFT